MKTAKLFLLVWAISLNTVSAQEDSTSSRSSPLLAAGSYFGQKPSGITPEIFAPGIISTDDHSEASITFSPDMSELFFLRRRQGESHNIYTMKLIDGKWSKPALASFSLNKEYLDFHPRFSPNGDRLYFGSTRPLIETPDSLAMQEWRGKRNSERLNNWYVEKSENGWGQPILLLEELFEGEWIMCVSASENGNLYFTSKEKEDKLEDEGIYYAVNVEGHYSSMKRMAKEINGYGKWIAHPFIAPDESYVLYDAERTSGEDNDDLYVSFNQNATWSESYSLGSKINTEVGQGAATVSPDGKYMFYRSAQKGDETSNIYWVSTEVIDQLRPKTTSLTDRDFPLLEGPYMGQKPPGMVAEPFAPGIISTEGWEVEGVFAPGMKEFYYTTSRGEPFRPTVIGFRQEGNIWKKYTQFKRRGEIAFSPDGSRMHMAKSYKDRIDDGWSERKSLGPSFEEIQIMRLTVSSEATYVFDEVGMPNGDGVIRYSRLIEGEREAPRAFGKEINTGRMNAHPFIAPDESYVIWDGEREKGFGDSDVYISFRQEDGSWGAAINMGDKVNSDKWDAYASVTPDGKYLFFNRGIDDNNDNVDIYWVDAQIIEDLRPKE